MKRQISDIVMMIFLWIIIISVIGCTVMVFMDYYTPVHGVVIDKGFIGEMNTERESIQYWIDVKRPSGTVRKIIIDKELWQVAEIGYGWSEDNPGQFNVG